MFLLSHKELCRRNGRVCQRSGKDGIKMHVRLLLITVTELAWLGINGASANDWHLAWMDTFDRTEIGQDWHLVKGKASIQQGKLFLKGAGATIVSTLSFKHDVKIEFDAQADPSTPPCDLSATIGANEEFGYGYLFAFGGANNQVNQILGFREKVVDTKPRLLIEPEKTYHIVALKEGKRLAYIVNGNTVVQAVTQDPIGGPGFDKVGLVTWAGMIVDNFKVYERNTPHPETPIYLTALHPGPFYREERFLKSKPGVSAAGLDEALKAFNARDYRKALSLFESIQDPEISLAGQCWVIGDLGYQEKPQYRLGSVNEEFAELCRRLEAASKANPTSKILREYSEIAKWLPELIMARSGMVAARRIVALGEDNNPFYHKAKLYLARYHYWNGAEAGDPVVKQQALTWMKNLLKLWPEHNVMRQYVGEKVLWGEEFVANTTSHPAWAAYLREAYVRQVKIMERFFAERQAPDGQLGGGYGDDVELMRTWALIASISTASRTVREGISRLAEGVWSNVLKDGFGELGDVEHSAEPSADTLPTMLFLDYGNPVWIERNLKSCKTLHDVCMGIDNKGYPRFKSAEIGWNGANTNPRAGGDTGYHARAMKHFIWQAWWGDEDAKDWFVRWCEGWRAAAMAERQGKLVGLVPFTIWFPSGDIKPPNGAEWYDQAWHYYGNMSGMIYDSLLCAYSFTRDRKFLEPFLIGMDTATRAPLAQGDFAPGSVEWQRQQILAVDSPQRTALYKWLTGERVYDEYTLRFGDPVQKYRVNYDLNAFLASFKKIAEANRYNLEMQTTEVLSTDRAALYGALTVFGAYTGAVTDLRDASTPTFAITYDTPDENFAAVVTESTPERLRVWLYSFAEVPVRIGLKVWRLLPGTYVMNQGELMPGEYEFQNRYGWRKTKIVRILRRADTVYVSVPARKVWVVDLRLKERITVPKKAPDLAVTARDIRLTKDRISVVVHNVGSARSTATWLSVQVQDESGKWKPAGRIRIPPIEPPRQFVPSTTQVQLPLPESALRRVRVVVDTENREWELFEGNNVVVIEQS